VKRFPLYVFGALIVATVAAFFVTQALKVTTPLVGGQPRAVPGWINPVAPGVCSGVSHRSTHMSFYLYRGDDVTMSVVNDDGTIVQTVASGRHMRRKVRSDFVWNGRQSDGSFAPDGIYHFRVALANEGRAVLVGGAIHVHTTPPRPVVTSVTPDVISAGGTPATVSFTGNKDLRSKVLIYRTDLPGGPRLVDSFQTKRHPKQATWDGTVSGGAPAPAGTYLVGLATTDLACNTGRFPIVLPPPPGTTAHAGVTVRYLAALPRLDPVPAGSRATVEVDSRTRPYRWTLSQFAGRKPLSEGAGRAPGTPLNVRLPRKAPGLYVLGLRSGGHQTAVPLVASSPRSAPTPRILVVLPALTWEAEILGDEDGDGLPDTLDAGFPVGLQRVFANGLPAGLADEAKLLAYFNRQHLAYDLTTDLGLIDGVGPALSAYRGVVLAGSERWLPSSLIGSLQSYVGQGGHVLSFGIDSLRRRVTIGRTSQGFPEALNPTEPSSADIFAARLGPVVHSGALITVINDGLGIFSGQSGAFPGFKAYQPIAPAPQPVSSAGPAPSSLGIVGYRLGGGFVVDVGLVGFGSSLAHDVDAQELVNRLWAVLSR
jgi:hypothetical protein